MGFKFAKGWRQQRAIMRRYAFSIIHTPIKSCLRYIIWPAFIIGFVIWALYKLMEANPLKRQIIQLTFIKFAPRFSVMTSIFHVYSFGGLLVRDKASGFKSLMISSGLKRFNYSVALSICSLLYLIPISLIMSVVTKVYLFDDTMSWPNLIMMLTLFALQMDSFIFFMVSFISSQSYTFVMLVIVFFEARWHLLADFLINQLGESSNGAILFVASVSPFETLRLFYDGYLIDHGYTSRTNTFGRLDPVLHQEISLIIGAQIFWTISMRLFACWSEEVGFFQTNTYASRNACFCLEADDERFDDSKILMHEKVGDPNFEMRANSNRDIGIQVANVTKRFHNELAVNDVTFTVYKGETTLLLGHNGAGKSTLMNMILGMLRADEGKVRVRARSQSGKPASIGICPQGSVLDDDLSVRQHLELFNDIKSDISGGERRDHVEQILDEMSLSENASKRPQELSGGMKRKLSLGIAFVGRSEVLILDEPSSGLDPDSRMFVWDTIRRHRNNRTVLLSTQHMEEADYLGDRIAIMSAGRIVCCGSSVFLNNLFGSGYKLRVECKKARQAAIINRIRRHFSEAHLAEDKVEQQQVSTASDTNEDFVVELSEASSSSSFEDVEMKMIELLEDFERNKDELGVASYGLKASSIEDVMLHTSRFFGNKSESSDKDSSSVRLTLESVGQHLDTLAQSRNSSLLYETPRQVAKRLLVALSKKQLNIYRANKFAVLLIKILMPMLGLYDAVNNANKPASMGSFWLNPAHALIVAHFIYFPIREHIFKFKIMQLNSDMSAWIYWLSWFLVDLAAVLFTLITINIFLTYALTVDVLICRWQFRFLVSGATLMFCLTSMVFCYLLSNIIGEPRSAYGHVVIIFALSTAAYILTYQFRLAVWDSDALGGQWLQDIVGYIGVALLPGDAFRLIFVGLNTKCYINTGTTATCLIAEGTSPVVIGLCALLAQLVVYASLLCLVEWELLDLHWYLNLKNLCCCFYKKPRRKMPASGGGGGDVDEDVQAETARAMVAIDRPNEQSSNVVANKLRKSYVKSQPVIQDLSFAVHRRECFGLLGVNGAGKTTTLSLLAGELQADSGRLLADGDYYHQNLERYRQKFGYDPQATQDFSLTPHQALHLMARLRGVESARILSVISAVLELLDMTQHEHKLDSELSGGTKRKLALGMALIGNPSILALDEPTAGVDPLARRGVWQLLKSLRTQSSVSIIISSHAMEECEAICDRISIMARGHLRCIGTFLHLRSKFAKGCSLRVQFNQATDSGATPIQDGASIEAGRQCVKSSDQCVVQTLVADPSGKPAMQVASDACRARQRSRGSSSDAQSTAATDKLVEELKQELEKTLGVGKFELSDRNFNSATFVINENQVLRSVLFRLMRNFRQKHPEVGYMLNDSSLEDIFISLAKEQQELERQEAAS